MNMVEAPIQLDASMGWVNAVQEMLLYVSPWLVKLLPAVPDKWNKGEFTGLCFNTGTISLSWDKQIGKFQANLVATRETSITLKLPDWFSKYSFIGTGVVIVSSTIGTGYYELKMMAGQSLEIASTE